MNVVNMHSSLRCKNSKLMLLSKSQHSASYACIKPCKNKKVQSIVEVIPVIQSDMFD